DRRSGFSEGDASSQSESHAMVAGMPGKARGDQIAHSGQPGERFGPAAESHPEAGHLGECPGDESGNGVVAKPESGGDARGDRVDVLDRTSELNPGDVVTGVAPEPR